MRMDGVRMTKKQLTNTILVITPVSVWLKKSLIVYQEEVH